jgi:hypothetical protein
MLTDSENSVPIFCSYVNVVVSTPSVLSHSRIVSKRSAGSHIGIDCSSRSAIQNTSTYP